MKAVLRWLQTGARVCYLVATWVLIAMVFVQFFYAGFAVLVAPGNWQPHVNFGSMFSLPIFLMAFLSLLGWMPLRFFLFSLALYGLYMLQYILVLMPGVWGMPALAALHPVNGLLIFYTAYQAARSAWRLVVQNKK